MQTNRMPPAAKKAKLRRTTGTTNISSTPDESNLVADAVIRCKRTKEYVDTYNAITLCSAKQINRKIGTTKWYRLNKDDLVGILVLNQFAEKIQKFFRDIVMMNDDCDDDDNNRRVCAISLVPMSEIPHSYRFKHANTWFDRDSLAQHMSITSDFVNPVTRVEFCEEDVLKIDPGLIRQFRDRKELRSSLAEDMAMVQSVENELEEVFQTMVDAAQEKQTRIEFRIVFNSLAEDFEECHGDLVKLDHDRASLTLKSLADVIRGDPNRPVHMSRKRERILKHFLENQV